MKIIALEESADFATLDTEKLFSKLKSHELSRKGRPNHDASFSSKALITGARVGGHVANPTNTTNSSALEFALSSLCAASDEQYESIPDDDITLLARKFRALPRFRKERRRSPRGCFECGHGFYGSFSNLLGMKLTKTYRKDCALYWDVYIICNVLILYLINCVTTKNELICMFVSLGSEVAEGSVLSGRIV
jgi:hypothetical protein